MCTECDALVVSTESLRLRFIQLYIVRTHTLVVFYPLCYVCFIFFFFSSRRRHTRLQGDWSSDVCSSDLMRPSSFIAFFTCWKAISPLAGSTAPHAWMMRLGCRFHIAYTYSLVTGGVLIDRKSVV